MLIFPDPNVETEYTDPNGSVWAFNGTGWVRQCDCDGSGGGGDGDPEWLNVSILINADGVADGSKNIIDATYKNPITVVNNAKVSTSEFKYGTGSVEFDQVSSSCLEVDKTSFSFPSGLFTVECWFLFKSGTTKNSGIFAFWGGTSERTLEADIKADEGLRVQICGASGSGLGQTNLVNSSTPMEANKWHHIAVSFNGSDYYCHLDGDLVGQLSTTVPLNPVFGRFRIGHLHNNDQYLDGFVDDLRVTDGAVRYSPVAITPPEQHPTKGVAKRAIVIQEDIPQTQEGGNDADLSSNDSEPLGDNQ